MLSCLVDAVVTVHPSDVLMKSDLKNGCKNYSEEREFIWHVNNSTDFSIYVELQIN